MEIRMIKTPEERNWWIQDLAKFVKKENEENGKPTGK